MNFYWKRLLFVGLAAGNVADASTFGPASQLSLGVWLAQSDPSQAEPVVPLPETVVRGAREPNLTVPSARVAEKEIQLAPGGVDLIPAESFRTGRTSTLKDVLDYSPGVFIQSRFGAEEARLSIRGSGLQRTFHGRGIKLLQDGVPLNLADGSFDFQAVEPLAVDYVEVFRGANAMRYGSTTLGGAVNYVSPTGHRADRLQLRAEYGSYDYLRGQASSGMSAGPVDYYLSLSEFYQSGFRDHAKQHTQRLFSNGGWKLREDLETRFYFTYVQTASELPGNLTKAQLEDDPRQANPNNVALDQRRDFELIRIANKTSWLGDVQRVDLSTWYFHKDLDHPIFQVIDQNSHDLGVDWRYLNEASWWGRANRLTLGLSPTYGELEDNRFANVSGRRGSQTGNSTQTAFQADLYAENQHSLTERLAVILGAQLSYAGRSFDDRFLTDGDQTDSEGYLGFNPKLGVRYDFSPAVQFYGNVSRSYEPPSFGELVRPPGPGVINGLVELDAQTATTIELGTRGNHGPFAWDLSVYRAWLRDELLSFEVPGAPGSFATVNGDETIHEGIELGGKVTLLDGWLVSPEDEEKAGDTVSLRAAYGWNHFHFQNDETFGDNQLPGVPEHTVRAELLYEHPSGWYGGPNVEWSPVRYPVDMANSLWADGYALLGVKVGYRAARGWSGFVEVRNITDETYAATTGVITRPTATNRAQFAPGDGRTFYVGLEWKF